MITSFLNYISEKKNEDISKKIMDLEKELILKKKELEDLKKIADKEKENKKKKSDYYKRKKRIFELEKEIAEEKKLKKESRVDSCNVRWYRNFKIVKHPDEFENGHIGLWQIPDLLYYTYANKLNKGFKEGTSILSCKEMIDKNYDLNQKIKSYKK